MKPKEILIKAINDTLKVKLEAEGFQFSESQLLFKRKLPNGLVEQINFKGNLRNAENLIVRFGEQYLIYSNSYKKWWTSNFPNVNLVGAGYLFTNNDQIVKMDYSMRDGTEYNFLTHNPTDIMGNIWKNYCDYGTEFFEQNNSWEKQAEIATRPYGRIDGLILSNQQDKALKYAIEIRDKYVEKYGDYDNIKTGAKQTLEIVLSRIEFLEKNVL